MGEGTCPGAGDRWQMSAKRGRVLRSAFLGTAVHLALVSAADFMLAGCC